MLTEDYRKLGEYGVCFWWAKKIVFRLNDELVFHLDAFDYNGARKIFRLRR